MGYTAKLLKNKKEDFHYENKKKVVLLVLCAAALMFSSALGTMAYLTDSKSVDNTFTIGKIGLTLSEAKVNSNGEFLDESGNVVATSEQAKRVTENSYRLLPGRTYPKDPTVTVAKGSESAYVRMKVAITCKDESERLFGTNQGQVDPIIKWLNISSGTDAKWKLQNQTPSETSDTQKGTTTYEYEFRYEEKISANDVKTVDKSLNPLFTTVKVPETLTSSDLELLENMKIHVTAEAMQADGFDDADQAWTAFDQRSGS